MFLTVLTLDLMRSQVKDRSLSRNLTTSLRAREQQALNHLNVFELQWLENMRTVMGCLRQVKEGLIEEVITTQAISWLVCNWLSAFLSLSSFTQC